ncbi:B12-binding domain-containing radical SAM protein [Paenibacillus tepidiphilus]|uniref:B12-binding domain-containing radical SAM protein n=1 Tax=Paenibacillus tepidiphilus TaxID=2608683 RepID=UPI0013A5B39F|nr:radical SAM protein [Paenibacillus tepidiphilus]
MDILLVNGVDFLYTNIVTQLGLLSLKNVLSGKYAVDIVNFDYLHHSGELPFKDTVEENIELFVDYLLRLNPKVVGFYTICNSYAITLTLARRIKESNRDIQIVFGGPQATLTAEDTLSYFPFVDVVALGESELFIEELMDALVNNKELAAVPSIAYREDGVFVRKEMCPLIPGDQLGSYTVFNYDSEEFEEFPRFFLEAGRGCPFGCTFCSTSVFWGRKFRIKPVGVLIDEMKIFYEKYDVKLFGLTHDMLTVNRKYIHEFCNRLIAEDLPFHWSCSSRIDILDDETIRLMWEAKCTDIYIGIETGSQHMQQNVKKNINIDKARSTILKLKETGFSLTVSFIYGFPDETARDLHETLSMMEFLYKHDIRRVQLHLYMPLPSTIETDKIKEQLYFDETDVDLSIYNAKIFNHELNDMVRKYPSVFLQFYTFESDVRNRYKRLDLLISLISTVMSYYSSCINYLIQKYGLARLYDRYRPQINDCHNRINEMPIDVRFDYESLIPVYFGLADTMFRDEIAGSPSLYFEQVYRCEDLLYRYFTDKTQEDVVYKFDIDIIQARRSGVCIEKESFIKFSRQNDKIKVSSLKLELV